MDGNRVVKPFLSKGRNGRQLTLALAIGVVGFSGLAAQDRPTTQPRTGNLVPAGQLTEQGVSVDSGGPPRAKTPAPVGVQVPGPGKSIPPSMRQRIELISAARQSAAEQLIGSVESQLIRSDLTVGGLLDALSPAARAELRAQLSASPQIGGARFPTPATAEVQLQADGATVVDLLVAMVRQAGDAAPIEVEELEARVAGWRGRTFTATGGSVSAAIGPELRARPESLPAQWSGVSEEARRNAFLEAHENAVNEFIDAVRPIEIVQDMPDGAAESTQPPTNAQPSKPNPLTIQKALARGKVEQDARQWLAGRPVNRLKYTEDRRVEVRLALEPAEWVEQLKVSLSHPDSGIPEISDQDWERLTARVAELLRARGPVGVAAATETELLDPVTLPARAPEWASQTITVRASAAPAATGGSASKRKLLTQQAALDAAREELRGRLGALPISEGQTLGNLAETRAAVRELVDAFVNAAQPSGASYNADGSVTVEVSATPRSLWQALERRYGPALVSPQS